MLFRKSANSNRKIVFFTAETYPSYAGSGRDAFRFAKYLVTKSYSCTIACYNYNHALIKRETVDGVKIHRYTYYNRTLAHKIIFFPNLVLAYFMAIVRNNQIILYGRYMIGFEFILLFSILFRKHIVFRSTLMGDDDILTMRSRSNSFHWAIRKAFLNRITIYWALNDGFIASWKSHLSSKVTIVNALQGIEIRKYQRLNINIDELRTELGLSKNGLIILSCGILIHRKGYRQIFESLSNLNISFQYVVVGQKQPDKYHRSSKLELREMKHISVIGKKYLGDKIKFVGTSEEILKYYHAADIFIHGADEEGMPNVVLEAIASGLPVIAKNNEAIRYLNSQQKKLLVSYNDNKELISLIQSFNNNPSKWVSEAQYSSEFIRNTCSFHALAKKLLLTID